MNVGHFPYKPGGNPYQRLFAEALEDAGVEVTRIPPSKVFPLHSALSHNIDLLQLDWPHDWYTSKGALVRFLKRFMYFRGLRKLRDFPCVWTVHNIVAHDADDKNDEFRMIQALIDCCDGLVVMSEAAKRKVNDSYEIKDSTIVEVVPHGHYIDVYENSISRDGAKESLGLAHASRVVLSLGRILPYKGIEELIVTFGSVAKAGDVLIVAGSVSCEMFLESLRYLSKRHCPSDAKIEIHPVFIADDKLQNYFKASDVVALPFRDILNSGSLLLAMSFGKCVVAPNAGSLPEIACPAGFFGYEQSDPIGLAAGLVKALSCSGKDELGRQILSFTREKYAWGKTGSKMLGLYEKLLVER